MSFTIAVSGKGGTGKTTLAGLITRWLMQKYKDKSILTVDADPNANLDQTLGVKSNSSIVSIIDDISKNPSKIPSGMTKDRFLEYQIQDALIEACGFDLLVMGRPEGPGCYCYANNLLRTLIKRLSDSYSYMLIDNEAGMEHLSRRIAGDIDILFILSDYSIVGLRSAKRIRELTKELKLHIEKEVLVINRAPKNDTSQLKEEIEAIKIPLAGILPEDASVKKLSIQAKSVMSISSDSPIVKAVNRLCEEAI